MPFHRRFVTHCRDLPAGLHVLLYLDTQRYSVTSVKRQHRTNVRKTRRLAHPVASRFDDCSKGIILGACACLRRRSRPGTVVVSKKAMTRKMITNSITAKR